MVRICLKYVPIRESVISVISVASVYPHHSISLIMAETTKKPSKKKKMIKPVPHGHAYIQATFNNTIVSIADQAGNVLGWASAGAVGFKGPKKATPFAASQVVKRVGEAVKPYGVKEVSVFVRGIGGGREGAIR